MLKIGQDDHTPYVFISYTKVQFGTNDDQAAYQRLYSWAIAATDFYADSLGDHLRKPRAFWIDIECQPLRRFDEATKTEYSVSDVIDVKNLVDHDVSFFFSLDSQCKSFLLILDPILLGLHHERYHSRG